MTAWGIDATSVPPQDLSPRGVMLASAKRGGPFGTRAGPCALSLLGDSIQPHAEVSDVAVSFLTTDTNAGRAAAGRPQGYIEWL